MKPGAIVANSGHFDVELDVATLRERAISAEEVRPNVIEYTLPSGRGVVVLAEGRLVGQSCAEAHPASIMDLGFSTKALTIEYMLEHLSELERVVYGVPAEIDQRVAQLKLAALGVRHDFLTHEQQEYLDSWTTGT
jgi:adenosylhomocysteinase